MRFCGGSAQPEAKRVPSPMAFFGVGGGDMRLAEFSTSPCFAVCPHLLTGRLQFGVRGALGASTPAHYWAEGRLWVLAIERQKP